MSNPTAITRSTLFPHRRNVKVLALFRPRNTLVIGFLFYLTLIPLIGIVPYWFPTNPDVASAASARGYNNTVAHILVFALSILVIGTLALCERYKPGMPTDSSTRVSIHSSPIPMAVSAFDFRHIAVVFVAGFLLYFPWFLSKYGPYLEDTYFLTVLHRMHGGQQAYIDFESLYGPLMLYIPYYWTRLAGYSMSSYYSLVALMEATQFAILLLVLQRFFKRFWIRVGVFLLLTAYLFNTLLGLSWNGLRRLLPVFILLFLAGRPRDWRRAITGGVLLGLLLGYSHEIGIVCLLAVITSYGFLILWEKDWTTLRPAVGLVGVALAVWTLSAALLLGGAFPAYVEASVYAVTRYGVEGGFPFYWTVNSLATFGLFSLGVWVTGCGLGRKEITSLESGDYLLFGGLVYALLGMKIGLNRADMWHLSVPMLALIVAFILPLPRRLFFFSYRVQRLATGLSIVMVITYFVALFPSGGYYAAGLLRGFRDSIAGPHMQARQVVTRGLTIEPERSHPSISILQLAEYLADPVRTHRPVVLYRELWTLDKHLGIYKTIYPTDDFLLSDEHGFRVRQFLQEHKDTIVIMHRHAYQQVFRFPQAPQDTYVRPLYDRTPTKKLLGWLSTIHYSAAEIENEQKARRWERTVGSFVASTYQKVAEFGDLIVLFRIGNEMAENGPQIQTVISPRS